MAEPITTDGPTERPAAYHKNAQWFAMALIVLIVVGLVIQSFLNLSGRRSIEQQNAGRESDVEQRRTSQDFEKEADRKMRRLQEEQQGKRSPFNLGKGKTIEDQAVTGQKPADPYQSVYEDFQKEEIRRALESRRSGLRPRGRSKRKHNGFEGQAAASSAKDNSALNRSNNPQLMEAKERQHELTALREQLMDDVESLKANPAGLSANPEGLRGNALTPRTASQISDQATLGEPVANRAKGGDQAQPKPGEVLLPTGTVLPGVLDMELISDYDGPWRGILSDDVYDANREYILFPKGSKVVGKSLRISNVNEPIQARMGLTANWLILPNGNRIDFRFAAPLDAAGVAALKGKVNYHLLAQFAGVSAYALLGVAPSLALESGGDPFSSREQALDDLTTRSRDQYRQLANRYLNLVPTIKLEAGTPFNLFIEDDLYITPWKRVNDTIYTSGIHRSGSLGR